MALFNSQNITSTLNSSSFQRMTLEQQEAAIAEYGYRSQIEGIKMQKRAANVQRLAAQSASQEQLQAAQFNIDSAKLNAETALQNQKFVLELTAENVKRLQEDNRLKVGNLRAKLAANGLAVDTGSPLELALEQAKQGELKEKDALLAGNVQARAYDLQAQQYMREVGRNQQNKENIIKAYDITMAGINVGTQVQQITALPSLLQSYQTMNTAANNSTTSLLGYK